MLTRFIPAIFVLLWSTGFITSKLAMPHAEPFSFLFVRFGAVMLVLAAVSLLLRAEWPRSRAALHGMVSGTLLHGAYLGGVFWAISHGMSSGISALIVSTQPILTAVLAPVVVGERVGWRHWLGLALGLAGVVMVLLPQIAQNSAGVELPTIAAAVVGLLGITFGNLYQKRFATALDLRTGGVCQFAGATLATLICAIASESGRIDWTKPAVELERLVRAMNPWPGAVTRLPSGSDLFVWRATVADGASAAPGTLLETGKRLLVSTGERALELTEVQLPGKRPLPAADFLRGARLEQGTSMS